jgi:RHS repeat-associated protein
MFNNKIIPIFLWVLILQGCKNVEVIVEGNGRVYDVVGEENINCGSGAGENKCKNSYGTGVDSVTFKAEPDLGYRLKDWGNSCKGDVCSSTLLGGIPELLKVAFEKLPTEISYTYNAGGQRVSKTVNGVTTFFIYQQNGSLLAELDANGNTLVDYIYLEGKPIAQVRPQSSGADDTAYIHADHIGAPKAATNQSGAVIWQIKTTPFGEVYSEAGTLAQNQRFPGQYADQESAFSYNYFRDYDPSTGRYIQSDLIGLRGGMNTYGYVGGNPITRIDPLGLAYRQERPLNIPYLDNTTAGPLQHDRFRYGDGSDSGYYGDGRVRPDDAPQYLLDKYKDAGPWLDDNALREAENNVQNNGWTDRPYNLNPANSHQCQDYSDAVENEYDRITGRWTNTRRGRRERNGWREQWRRL